MEKRELEFKESYLKRITYRRLGIWACKLNELDGNQLSNWNLILNVSNRNMISIINKIKSKWKPFRLKPKLNSIISNLRAILPKPKTGFSIDGIRISDDKLSMVWQAFNDVFNANKPMPKIDAVLMDKDEFIRVMEIFHNTGVKMEGLLWEYGYLLSPSSTGSSA